MTPGKRRLDVTRAPEHADIACCNGVTEAFATVVVSVILLNQLKYAAIGLESNRHCEKQALISGISSDNRRGCSPNHRHFTELLDTIKMMDAITKCFRNDLLI
uniref:Uncharacterized protein n=1 Tax=Romanomermis culicivorax TaxID=13658 RepID=A0A915KRH5_ROMCU